VGALKHFDCESCRYENCYNSKFYKGRRFDVCPFIFYLENFEAFIIVDIYLSCRTINNYFISAGGIMQQSAKWLEIIKILGDEYSKVEFEYYKELREREAKSINKGLIKP